MEILAGYGAGQLALAVIAALAAAFVRGLAGFGMAILLVPVLALAMLPVEAVLVTNCLAVMIGATEFVRLVRDAEKSALVISGLVILTTAPGLVLLAATPPDIARVLIAIAAMTAFGAVLFPVRPATPPGPAATGITGVLSGLLTGFAGMPGLPVVPYYVARDIARKVAKASMLLIFTVAALAGIGSGLAIGAFEWRFLGLALLLFPFILIGNRIGMAASGRVGDKAWRGFTAAVLGATALASLIKLVN